MGYAALFSGGKDSTYAVHLARESGLKVSHLVTMVSRNPESYMFHIPNIELTRIHAEALGIKLVRKETSGEKERELADLSSAVGSLDVEGIIVGAVASSYQMSRVEKLCRKLRIELYAPLWRRDGEELLRNFVRDGFECIFVAVQAEGFDEKWLGRRLDDDAIADLLALKKRFGINISGEGGEYETFVLDGPGFGKRIRIEDSEKVWKRDSGHLVVRKARFE